MDDWQRKRNVLAHTQHTVLCNLALVVLTFHFLTYILTALITQPTFNLPTYLIPTRPSLLRHQLFNCCSCPCAILTCFPMKHNLTSTFFTALTLNCSIILETLWSVKHHRKQFLLKKTLPVNALPQISQYYLTVIDLYREGNKTSCLHVWNPPPGEISCVLLIGNRLVRRDIYRKPMVNLAVKN